MGRMPENQKNKKKPFTDEARQKRSSSKLKVIATFLAIIITSLSVRVVYIKAAFGDEYERRAIVQQVSRGSMTERTIMPNRGSILDRNKSVQALAISTTVYNVYIDPMKLLMEKEEKQAETIEKVSRVLELSEYELRKTIDDNPKSNYKVVAYKVSVITKEAMESEKAAHVHFEEDTQRRYPGGNVAASLIGFIRGESVWGLEQRYDGNLGGTFGRELRIFDENNNAVTEKIEPIKGDTLITTIDLVLQQEAQKLVAHYGEKSLAKNAALIVANPNTGEILAMAEYPSFDLNDPFNIEKINSEYHKNLILNAPEEEQMNMMYEICRNFSVIDTFEPGSIYKPLVYAAAIEESVISEHETFYCGGGKDFYGEWIPCHYTPGHGHQTYKEALANSCNVAVMDVVARLGRESYYKYQCDFGIGGTTGIDTPGEPNTERLVHGLAALNPVELAVSSMGQGLNTTSIQMVSAFSSLINGGNLMKPYLVSQVMDENGNVVADYTPTTVRKVISKETSDFMKSTMVAVLEGSGTGRKAAIAGYRIGGKTGTGQQGDKSDPNNNDITLTFMSYFPADNPEYIVLSVINLPENYQEGNSQTLPMSKDMMNFIITQKNIPAYDKQLVNESLDSDTLTIENYVGWSIAEAASNLNYYGFSYDVSGSGDIVKAQFPSGGSKVTKGSRIYITLEQSAPDVPLRLVPNVEGMTEVQAKETIISAGLIPIIIDNTPETANSAPSAEGEEPVEVLKTVANQLPKHEIRIQEGTEILIYVEPATE